MIYQCFIITLADNISTKVQRKFKSCLMSKPDLLHHIAVKDADREDTKITFDELNKKSNRLARSLVVHFGDRIVGTSNLLYIQIRIKNK